MPRYIGLDLHRRYVHGCEWIPETQHERHFRFPNSRDGWSQFIASLDSDCWIAIEVTGNVFQVYDLLSPHAAKVLLANPIELKRLGSGRHEVDPIVKTRFEVFLSYCSSFRVTTRG